MYYHKITEYEIKCCMHAHHVPPRAPSSRGELYRRKTLFLDDFPIFFYYPNGTWTHPATSKLFLDYWNFFNFAKPLRAARPSLTRSLLARHETLGGTIAPQVSSRRQNQAEMHSFSSASVSFSVVLGKLKLNNPATSCYPSKRHSS